MATINKLDLGAVSAYALAVEQGYTGTEEEFATLMAQSGANAQAAEASKEGAEAWAVGQRGGVDVPDTDPTYQNNAKYYAEQAGDANTAAQGAKEAAQEAAASASAAYGTDLLAPNFVEGTANDPGSYVIYSDGKMYLLPDGHTAGATWANTTKIKKDVGGEIADAKSAMKQNEKDTLFIFDTLSSSDFESGGWSYTKKVTNSKRLRNKTLIQVNSGDIIQYSNPTMQMFFGVFASLNENSYLENSGWISAGATDSIWRINYNGFLAVMVQSASDITVSDYDSTVSFGETTQHYSTALNGKVETVGAVAKEAHDALFGSTITYCQIKNGTLANVANENAICISNYVPCENGDTVIIYPVRPVATGCEYRYAYQIYDSEKTTIVNASSALASNGSVVINNANAAYIRFAIFEHNGDTYNPLRANEYNYEPYVIAQSGESLEARINTLEDDVEQLKDDISELKDTPTYTKVIQADDLESGTWGYSVKSANSKRLRNKMLIPVRAGESITYSNPTMQLLFGVMENYNSYAYLENSGWINAGGSNAVFRINYNGYLVILIQSESNISVSDYNSTITIALYREANELIPYKNLISQARYVFTTNDSGIASTESLTLMHISDMHGDGLSMRFAMDVLNVFSDKIDDSIHTGDTVLANYSDGIDNWIVTGCAENIMNVIGNHDTSLSSVLQAAGKGNVYDRFIAPYVSGWDVVQPTGVDDSSSDYYKVLYYYKDYATKGIRLIVLDTNFWDDYEKTWLAETLTSAKTLEYSVILACHDVKKLTAMTSSNFSSFNGANINETTNTSANQPDNWLDPVDDFIEGGGKFVCILAGHNHMGHMGYMTNYPDIFVYVSEKSSCKRVQGTNRIKGETNENHVSIVSVDPANKLFKMVVIGANVDGKMRGRHVFCYNYETKQIVSQW